MELPLLFLNAMQERRQRNKTEQRSYAGPTFGGWLLPSPGSKFPLCTTEVVVARCALLFWALSKAWQCRCDTHLGLGPREYDPAGLEWGSGIRIKKHQASWYHLSFLGNCLSVRYDCKVTWLFNEPGRAFKRPHNCNGTATVHGSQEASAGFVLCVRVIWNL